MTALIERWHVLLGMMVGFDQNVFHDINQVWVNPSLDRVMVWVTSYQNTKWIIAAFFILLIFNMKKKAVPVIIGCALSILVADVTAARVIKPLVGRSRPQYSAARVRLIVPSQSSPSFPSNHAANTFAVGTFLALSIPGLGPFALFLAALVSYSRVYVGVHYPLDVLGGAVVGILSGILIFQFFGGLHSLAFPKAIRYLPKKWKKRDYLNR